MSPHNNRQLGASALRWLVTIALLAIIAAALGVCAWFYRDYRQFVDAPLAISTADSTFDVARGTSLRDIATDLRNRHYSDAEPIYWRVLGRELEVGARLHAGEYALPIGTTPRQLLLKMAAGDVLQHRFTIVDGWTFKELRVALANESGLQQRLAAKSDADIATELGIAEAAPEGWFLPETYAWIKGDADLDVLKRAHAAMGKALDRLWSARDQDVPLKSPYEALILASIVEKESGHSDERAQIAGVFARRLKLGMRLQTDPTVIYGLGANYNGRLRRADLDGDTPWNTYTRDGLPPTPIALPGESALESVMHPAQGKALYFVAVGDGSGRHVFSATLDEHNHAVANYLAQLKPANR
ncbi:MAG: endolytic transglycosylase MltG [Dokdonella sp.]